MQQQGETILSSLGRIQDPQASQLVTYIRKLLNSGVGEVAADNNISSNGSVATTEKQIPQFLAQSSQYSGEANIPHKYNL